MQVKTHREVLEPCQTGIKGDLIQHKPTSFGKELSASITKDSTCKPKKEEPIVPTTVLDITRIQATRKQVKVYFLKMILFVEAALGQKELQNNFYLIGGISSKFRAKFNLRT